MELTPYFWQQTAHEMNLAVLSNRKASAVVKDLASTYGLKPKTIYRLAKKHGFNPNRKKRFDAGRIDTQLMAALIEIAHFYHYQIKKESRTPLEVAIEMYQQLHPEVILPSRSHIHTLLRQLGLSRRQVRKPTPKLEIKSLYPNHLHIYDSSVCNYWLTPKNNIEYLPVRDFYKNKAFREQHAAKQILVRHILIDHCSNALFPLYTTTHKILDFADFLFNAWKFKEDFPFHGVGEILLMDNDSVLRSYPILQLLKYLGVRVPNVEPYRPWVKSVGEQIQSFWERHFESRFLFVGKRVLGLEQINQWAYEQAIHIQSTRVHSRHKMTRFAAFQTVPKEHLRELPPYQVYQRLLHSQPSTRKVDVQGNFSYKGTDYKLKDTELFGHKIDIIEHPYQYQKTKAVTIFFPSNEVNQNNFVLVGNKTYTVEPYVKDFYGFPVEVHHYPEYRALKNTLAENNMKEVEKVEIPDTLQPFAIPGGIDTTYLPIKGKEIQVESNYSPQQVEYSKIEVKLKIARKLKRHLEFDEARFIDGLEKTVFNETDIDEILQFFKLGESLEVRSA